MAEPIDNGTVRNGDRCEAIVGPNKGRSGIVEDWKLSKSGHATITVREASGERFKIVARNVRKT